MYLLSLVSIAGFFIYLMASSIFDFTLSTKIRWVAGMCALAFLMLFISAGLAKKVKCKSCGALAFLRKNSDVFEPDIVNPLVLYCVHCAQPCRG